MPPRGLPVLRLPLLRQLARPPLEVVEAALDVEVASMHPTLKQMNAGAVTPYACVALVWLAEVERRLGRPMADTDDEDTPGSVSPRRCIGMTKHGTRCRRTPDYGSEFCHEHAGADRAALPAWDAEADTLVDLCADATGVLAIDPRQVGRELGVDNDPLFGQFRRDGLAALQVWLTAYLSTTSPVIASARTPRAAPDWRVRERSRPFVNRWGAWGRAADPKQAVDLARRAPALAEARHIDNGLLAELAGWIAAVLGVDPTSC